MEPFDFDFFGGDQSSNPPNSSELSATEPCPASANFEFDAWNDGPDIVVGSDGDGTLKPSVGTASAPLAEVGDGFEFSWDEPANAAPAAVVAPLPPMAPPSPRPPRNSSRDPSVLNQRSSQQTTAISAPAAAPSAKRQRDDLVSDSAPRQLLAAPPSLGAPRSSLQELLAEVDSLATLDTLEFSASRMTDAAFRSTVSAMASKRADESLSIALSCASGTGCALSALALLAPSPLLSSLCGDAYSQLPMPHLVEVLEPVLRRIADNLHSSSLRRT